MVVKVRKHLYILLSQTIPTFQAMVTAAHRISNIYLFPHRHATSKPSCEGHNFGHKSFESEILLEDHSSHNGLELWDPRP